MDKKILISLRFLAVVLLIIQTNVYATPGSICPNRMVLDVQGNDLSIAYCGNIDADTVYTHTDRILVVIHGNSRNAEDYFTYAENTGVSAQNSDQTTAIIAPYFLTESDLDTFSLGEDMLFWSSGGWKKGNTSNSSASHPRPANISSFAVVNELLNRLILNNPNASQVVIVGHSAGGQYVNRYAAGADINPSAVAIRYVAANPSSWLYFSEERALNNSTNVFGLPDASACPEYDDYKYGLQQLSRTSYMNNIGVNMLIDHYQAHNVVYLLGENDNDPNATSMDNSCSAVMQGNQRLARGETYFNYVNWFYGVPLANHLYQSIPGVGHSASAMFQSDCGVWHLFDYDLGNGANCATTNLDLPAAPSNLTISVQTSGKGRSKQRTADLNWNDNSDNEDEFVVERCQETGKGKNKQCDFVEITTTTATVYSETLDSGIFKFRVKAINENGGSAYSNEVGV